VDVLIDQAEDFLWSVKDTGSQKPRSHFRKMLPNFRTIESNHNKPTKRMTFHRIILVDWLDLKGNEDFILELNWGDRQCGTSDEERLEGRPEALAALRAMLFVYRCGAAQVLAG
jgi:hypothetical protein